MASNKEPAFISLLPRRDRVLFSYLVPISLFVSLEIVKFVLGAFFLNRDVGMRDPATGEHALARNTNIIEDLGAVTHVFSDKTVRSTTRIVVLHRLWFNHHLCKGRRTMRV